MSPDNLSAEILNRCVLALSQLEKSLDYSLSMKEYSLGSPLAERNLQLGYGLSAIKSNNNNNLLKILVLGQGFCLSNYNGYVFLPSSGYENGLTLNDLFNTTDVYENCYVLGSIYLSTDASNEYIYATLIKPTNETSLPYPLVLHKDISIDEVLDLLESHVDIQTQPSLPDNDSVELYKFVLDIDYYNGDLKKARVGLYLLDQRKINGLLNFADEDLSFTFIGGINNNDIQVTRIYNKTKTNIKNIISNWVNLSSWTPDFVTYWNDPLNVMPTPLKNFIETELGIII